MTTPQERLENMVYAYDEDFDDSDGESDMNGDFSNAVLDQLRDAGLLTSCMYHGLYATFRGQCPVCNYCNDCEESPCCCDNDEGCSDCGEDPCCCEEEAS